MHPDTHSCNASPATDEETARQMAEDPMTPAAELERLVGRSAALDQKLARHPNIPLRLYRALAQPHPEAAWANAAMGRLIDEDPGLLQTMPELLAQAQCPASHLRWAAAHGSRGLQLAVLRNPAAPADVRALLTPDYFYSDAVRRLEAFAQVQPTPALRSFVEAYIGMARRYCLPRFLPLDRSNPAHRLADQVGSDFPFTSAAWPWPTEYGKHMQPVAQINLGGAGKLLGEKLGDGLVQCWTVTRPQYLSQCEPLIRTIPKASLLDAMDNVWPEDAAWNQVKKYNDYGEISRHEECWIGQRVEWIPMGRMFPDPIRTMVGEWRPERLGYADWDDAEGFANEIKQTGFPADLHSYFGQVEGVRLGGFPDGVDFHASEWLDWEQFIEDVPLSFDNILTIAGRTIIGKGHLSSRNV